MACVAAALVRADEDVGLQGVLEIAQLLGREVVEGGRHQRARSGRLDGGRDGPRDGIIASKPSGPRVRALAIDTTTLPARTSARDPAVAGAPSHGVAITTRSASAAPAFSAPRSSNWWSGQLAFSSWQASRARSSTRSRWRPPRRPRPAGWRAPSRPGRSPEHADAQIRHRRTLGTVRRALRGRTHVNHEGYVGFATASLSKTVCHTTRFTSSNRSSRAPLRMAAASSSSLEPEPVESGSMRGRHRGPQLQLSLDDGEDVDRDRE